MARVATGDSAAFRRLFDRHGSRVLGYCSRFMGGRSKAEDVAQEVWMKVVRAASHYRGEGKFLSWLLTIARTSCLSELRAQGEFAKEAFEELADLEGDPSPSADQYMEQAQDIALLKKCIDELPDSQRVVLNLWMNHESSYEEISRETSLSPAAVKSLLFRARQTLERKLKGEP